jgi:hypothetical protein
LLNLDAGKINVDIVKMICDLNPDIVKMEAQMQPETMFQIVNPIALLGWASLLASPFVPRLADRVASLAIPLLLAVVYVGLVLAFWTRAEGGFDSLAGVSQLFQTPEMLLAGWVHYLAFDLFVGAWIVRTAREAAVPFYLVIPCLALTFLFGPAGFLAFVAIRAARTRGIVAA